MLCRMVTFSLSLLFDKKKEVFLCQQFYFRHLSLVRYIAVV